MTFAILMNIEKRKSKKKLHSTICWISKNESQKIFDIRHHDEYRKTEVNIFSIFNI